MAHPGTLQRLVEVLDRVGGSQAALDGRPCPLQVTLPAGQLGLPDGDVPVKEGDRRRPARQAGAAAPAAAGRPRATSTASPCGDHAALRPGRHQLRERPRPAARTRPSHRSGSGPTARGAGRSRSRTSQDRSAGPARRLRRRRRTRPPGRPSCPRDLARSYRARSSISGLPAAAARARAAANSVRALAGSSYCSIMPRVIRTSASSSALPSAASGRQGLVAPAAGLRRPPGIDQRLGDGGGHPGPQPGGRLGRAPARPPGRGPPAPPRPGRREQVQAEALVGTCGPGRVRGPRQSVAASWARLAARWSSPAALAAAAARSVSSTRSMPAAAAGSGTRSHSPSALCRWRRASAGARTASASSAARTDAASAPARSWLARQWWASSAAAPSGSAASSRA